MELSEVENKLENVERTFKNGRQYDKYDKLSGAENQEWQDRWNIDKIDEIATCGRSVQSFFKK